MLLFYSSDVRNQGNRLVQTIYFPFLHYHTTFASQERQKTDEKTQGINRPTIPLQNVRARKPTKENINNGGS